MLNALNDSLVVDGTSGPRQGVNWRQVGAFLGLTLGITWTANLLFWLSGSCAADLAVTVVVLQWQMLVPASCAIVLQHFFFRDSPLHFRTYRGGARWFFYAFLLSAALQTGLAVWVVVMPAGAVIALASILVLQIAILLFVLALRLVSGRESFARAGLSGGRLRYWVLFSLGLVLFFAAQSALNLASGLGRFPSGTQQDLAAQGLPGELYPLVLAIVFLASMFLDPIMALGGGTFGEEYGWRGYLQGELIKLGKRRGVLLVGLVWAVWHYPIILMGRHTYPASALGLSLMAGFCVLLGFVLGYAMLKTGSIWLVAYLHGLTNALIAYMHGFIARPHDIVFSFGIGVLGLGSAALVVLAIVFDPVWRTSPDDTRPVDRPPSQSQPGDEQGPGPVSQF